MTNISEPQSEDPPPLSVIIHQPTDEQMLHYQTLTDAEYFMIHLFKTGICFRPEFSLATWENSRESGAICCLKS